MITKKKRNRGACAKVHAQIVEMSKHMLFKDMVKALGIPKTTLKDYCDKNSITVNHGCNFMSDHTDKIIELADKGFHTKQIAKVIGVEPSSLKYHIRKLGIKVRNGKYLEDNLEEEMAVIDLYNQNFTYIEIAEKLGIPPKRVPLHLDKHGIDKRSMHESQKARSSINLSAFSDMGDEETVYWLGWIITDGCLGDSNSISLGLKGEDVEIVKTFRDYIKPDCEVKVKNYFHKQSQKIVSSASISVRSKEVADNLRLQNVEPRKSCRERLPNFDYINSHLAPVFWRACIEGDGHVRKSLHSSGIDLVGSEELLCGFKDFCEKVCGVKEGKHLRKRNYGNPDFRIISYTGSDARKIMRILWSSGSIFLERKKKTVEAQLKHWGDK